MTSFSGDSARSLAVQPRKIQAKQRPKNNFTQLLGLQRVNGIYFTFFAVLLLIDSNLTG
jgi:hypothetical protein